MKKSAITAILLLLLTYFAAQSHFREMDLRTSVADTWLAHRTLSRALVAYQIDNGDYPPSTAVSAPVTAHSLLRLSTPVAYLPQLPRDPFQENNPGWFRYRNRTEDDPVGDYFKRNGAWIQFSLTGIGPDRIWSDGDDPMPYDPSNGLVSEGDIETRGPSDNPPPLSIWKAELKR
jgi:hypothetical protein